MALARDLFDAIVRHQVYVQRLASGEVVKLVPFLREMDRSVRDRLEESGELTALGKVRLERLLAGTDSLLRNIYTRLGAALKRSLFGLAQYEAGFSAQALDAAARDFESVMPALPQVRAAVLSTPLSITGPARGKLLEAFVSDWSQSERRAVTGVLRRGAYEGKTNAELVREIRGTAARNYADGLLDVTRRHAEAVVRTAVQHVSTVAREKTFEANADVIRAYEWVATLDKRTCPSCRSLDGREFPKDKGPRPPLHVNCRCTLAPVLIERYAALNKGATRASKGEEGGAQVPADLSYYEWLKTQSAEFQDDVLGPTRGKLFRDGGLTAARFAELQLDKTYQPLTLDEMRARNPIAFRKAGL
jgi:SPP1 gp7 family putative phage head morphogenesis protein